MVRKSKKQKDVWQTPDVLLDNIAEEITLDPCAGQDTSIGKTNYTVEDDGLSKEWFGTVFANPPFSKKGKFLDKAIESVEQGDADTVYFVTPDSTDVKSWWHGQIAPNARYIWFSEGRIQYIDAQDGTKKKNVTFGTAISMYGTVPRETLRNFDKTGHLVQSVDIA